MIKNSSPQSSWQLLKFMVKIKIVMAIMIKIMTRWDKNYKRLKKNAMCLILTREMLPCHHKTWLIDTEMTKVSRKKIKSMELNLIKQVHILNSIVKVLKMMKAQELIVNQVIIKTKWARVLSERQTETHINLLTKKHHHLISSMLAKIRAKK